MLARWTLLLIALSFSATAQPAYYSETFIVTGKVWRPGKYFIQEYKRVYDALQGAGGLKNDADRKVSIQRGDKEYTFDYGAYLRGERIEENILLQNGDGIVVR
jgi:protein involved in polysaccharide export with SLBB domain